MIRVEIKIKREWGNPDRERSEVVEREDITTEQALSSAVKEMLRRYPGAVSLLADLLEREL